MIEFIDKNGNQVHLVNDSTEYKFLPRVGERIWLLSENEQFENSKVIDIIHCIAANNEGWPKIKIEPFIPNKEN
ncbi:hypothetical protein [Reichenbachiella sp.]|uniref:hypothetical protein n=1 Tax=Reichenbachiella sp. TaxID=2184521 RepID=UPI003B5AC426